jgi:hypothetical protein
MKTKTEIMELVDRYAEQRVEAWKLAETRHNNTLVVTYSLEARAAIEAALPDVPASRSVQHEIIKIAAECARREPISAMYELTEATHIGHRQFSRAYYRLDDAIVGLSIRLKTVADMLSSGTALPDVPTVPEILAAFPLFEEEGLDEEEHCCEWSLQQDRKRLHAMLSAAPEPVQAEQPKQKSEQAAFEDWLYRVCPSGDVTEVQRQWEASSDLANWLEAQAEQPCNEPVAQQEPFAYFYHDALSAEMANSLVHSTLFVLAKDRRPSCRNETPLYTSPQVQQPMSDEQADKLIQELGLAALSPGEVIRQVEAFHKIGG